MPIDLAPDAALIRTIPVGDPGKRPGAVIDRKLQEGWPSRGSGSGARGFGVP